MCSRAMDVTRRDERTTQRSTARMYARTNVLRYSIQVNQKKKKFVERKSVLISCLVWDRLVPHWVKLVFKWRIRVMFFFRWESWHECHRKSGNICELMKNSSNVFIRSVRNPRDCFSDVIRMYSQVFLVQQHIEWSTIGHVIPRKLW